MKKHQLLMATLVTILVCGSAVGDDDKLFGNGRFLRRLRNDITGRTPDPKPANQNQKSDSRANGKSPTPATPPGQRVPTPTKNAPKQSPLSLNSLIKPSRTTRPTTPTSPTARQPAPSRIPATHNSAPATAKRSSKQGAVGFGMLIELRDKELVVSQIQPRGNASEAGVRKGDVIHSAGGVPLGSIDEFNEISKILGGGDQLEFEIARRGKKDKVLIQFGDAPDEDEVAAGTKPSFGKPQTKKFEFVPEAAESGSQGLRSVLGNPSARTTPSTNTQVRSAANPNSFSTSSRNNNSIQTIQQQQQTILQLQREVERLRLQPNGSNQVAPADPVGTSILTGPRLNGPGK